MSNTSGKVTRLFSFPNFPPWMHAIFSMKLADSTSRLIQNHPANCCIVHILKVLAFKTCKLLLNNVAYSSHNKLVRVLPIHFILGCVHRKRPTLHMNKWCTKLWQEKRKVGTSKIADCKLRKLKWSENAELNHLKALECNSENIRCFIHSKPLMCIHKWITTAAQQAVTTNI
jgi:hypothetical protein